MAEERIAGRYRLLDRLGTGGMSEVWRAEDEELERVVAVKLLRPDADRARFEREARSVAALSHPNINHLYDYGESEGRPYMVLEYLPGGSLEERLEPGAPFPDDATLQVATDVAAGLAHAHAHGLVHRDLKPANVLFDAEERAKLADFGIARLGGAGTLTEAGTVLGTANFISPEQASGADATPASDVYSFGVILFRLLTGRLPFEGDDAMAVATMHATQPPPSIADLRSDAPAPLEALAAAALRKAPEERPQDGTAVLRELAAAAPTTALAAAAAPTSVLAATEETQLLRSGTGAPAAPPRAPIPPPRPPRGRTPLVAGLIALVLLGAAGAAVAVLMSGHGPDTTTARSTIPKLSLPTITTRKHTTSAATTTAPPTTSQQTTTRQTTTRRTPPPTTAPPPPPTTAPTTATIPTTVGTTLTVPPTTTGP